MSQGRCSPTEETPPKKTGDSLDSDYCIGYTYCMMELWEPYRDVGLPLEELVAVAGRAIRRLRAGPVDGRVSVELDARVVRYYQTLGLLDKPHRFDGRKAIYGVRHLLQLLSIKKLQADGYPLALIQENLAGRSTAQLEAIVGEISPVAVAAQAGGGSAGASPSREMSPVAAAAPAPPARQELFAAQAAPGVTVVIDPALVADARTVLDRIREALGNPTEECP